jgi:hypothetical protein
MSMSPPPAPEPLDEEAPAVPQPPRRVPFGIAVVTALLGLVTVLLLIVAGGGIGGVTFDGSMGRAAGVGLMLALLVGAGAVSGAVTWSFVRNGNQLGALVVGALTAVTGLVLLGTGLAGSAGAAVAWGVVAIPTGLLITLVPLLGHGPGYLAARRVWARAEAEWLDELTAAPIPEVDLQHPALRNLQYWDAHWGPVPPGWTGPVQWGPPPERWDQQGQPPPVPGSAPPPAP